MTSKRKRVIAQNERKEALVNHYKNLDSVSQKEIDHISTRLKRGITHISYENRERGPRMGAQSIHELIWAIGRKVNGH
jgi:hypothetical protein